MVFLLPSGGRESGPLLALNVGKPARFSTAAIMLSLDPTRKTRSAVHQSHGWFTVTPHKDDAALRCNRGLVRHMRIDRRSKGTRLATCHTVIPEARQTGRRPVGLAVPPASRITKNQSNFLRGALCATKTF